MSVRIQDGVTNCCAGITEAASQAVQWIGNAASTAGSYVVSTVQKVADFAKPHFNNLKAWAQQNKESLLIAGIAFAVGAILTAITYSLFCQGTTPPTSSGTSALTSSATSAVTTH